MGPQGWKKKRNSYLFGFVVMEWCWSLRLLLLQNPWVQRCSLSGVAVAVAVVVVITAVIELGPLEVVVDRDCRSTVLMIGVLFLVFAVTYHDGNGGSGDRVSMF